MRRLLVALAAVLMVLGVTPTFAGAASAPPAPKNLSISTEPGVASLSWGGSSEAGGYNVYRDDQYIDTVKGQTTYRDSHSPGVYSYYVTAFDPSGDNFSSKSSRVEADTRGQSDAPGTEGSDERTDGGGDSSGPIQTPFLQRVSTQVGEATLHFSPVSGATGYNVYRDGNYLTTTDSSPYVDKANPGRYSYYLTAFDSDKNFSSKSNQIQADTRGNTNSSANADDVPESEGAATLSRPRIIHARTTGRFVEIKWTKVSGAVGVNVSRNGTHIGSVNFPANVFNDTGGKEGDTYTLVAYAGKIYSEKSAPQVVGDSDSARFDASARVTEDARVVITWVAKANRRYVVWRSTSGSFDPTTGSAIRSVTAAAGGPRVFYDDSSVRGSTYLVQEQEPDGTVVAVSPLLRPDFEAADGDSAFQKIRLSVNRSGRRVTLNWSAPSASSQQYTVVHLRVDPRSGRVNNRNYTTGERRFPIDNVGSSDAFAVVVQGRGGLEAASGVHDWNGNCIAMCRAADWDAEIAQELPEIQPRVIPAIVIGVVVRAAARRVVQWCLSDGIRCANAANDAANLGGQIYDTFIQDNPASVVANDEVEELEGDGFEITDRNPDDNSITLERGNTTVTIRTLETVRGEEGRVVRTEVDRNDNGDVTSERVDYSWASEDTANGAQVDRTYTVITTYYRNAAGEIVGRSTAFYDRGTLVNTDCVGQTASTGCSNTRPSDGSGPGPDLGFGDSDGDGTIDALDPDPDGDGIPTGVDRDPFTGTDTDGDGVADVDDWDSDNDGIPDVVDLEPTKPYTPTPSTTPGGGDKPGKPAKPALPCGTGSMDAAAASGSC